MKKYAIGLITGALLAVSSMMFMGAQNNAVEQDIAALKIDVLTLETESTACFVLIANLEDDFNSNRRKTSQTLSEIQQSIVQLREEKKRLESEKTRLETDYEYIEQLARERYRMAKPGEKVFKVVPKEK